MKLIMRKIGAGSSGVGSIQRGKIRHGYHASQWKSGKGNLHCKNATGNVLELSVSVAFHHRARGG